MSTIANTRARRRRVRSKPATAPANQRALSLPELGQRVRGARERRRMSLEALSDRAHVSRSMLSAIERGLKSPTVLVLDRIATGLDTSLARLLATETRARLIVMQR